MCVHLRHVEVHLIAVEVSIVLAVGESSVISLARSPHRD